MDKETAKRIMNPPNELEPGAADRLLAKMDRTFLDRILTRPSKADQAYINLNNLYLEIERGDKNLNRRQYNLLNEYLNGTYPPNEMDPMRDWWWKEFQKLPNWLNV